MFRTFRDTRLARLCLRPTRRAVVLAADWSCGFAAFRAVRLCLTGTSIYFEAMPRRDIRGAASKNKSAIGKAEPFRTEGGKAAIWPIVVNLGNLRNLRISFCQLRSRLFHDDGCVVINRLFTFIHRDKPYNLLRLSFLHFCRMQAYMIVDSPYLGQVTARWSIQSI